MQILAVRLQGQIRKLEYVNEVRGLLLWLILSKARDGAGVKEFS